MTCAEPCPPAGVGRAERGFAASGACAEPQLPPGFSRAEWSPERTLVEAKLAGARGYLLAEDEAVSDLIYDTKAWLAATRAAMVELPRPVRPTWAVDALIGSAIGLLLAGGVLGYFS